MYSTVLVGIPDEYKMGTPQSSSPREEEAAGEVTRRHTAEHGLPYKGAHGNNIPTKARCAPFS
jgi:hypothetical protein